MFVRIKKRRSQALTDYRKRVALLTGGRPRVVVRKSNRSVLVQIIDFHPEGDKVLTSATSNLLRKFGWEPRGNIPTAYLTGFAAARIAQTKNLKLDSLVLDIGLSKPQKSSVVFAAAKGAVDGGLKIASNIEFDANRLNGAHIANYAKSQKGKFTGYAEKKFDPERMVESFEAAKKKLMEMK